MYETLREMTSDGKVPVTDEEVLSYLIKNGYSISLADLTKILLKLEIMGLVRVSSSTKEDRQIEFVGRHGNAEEAKSVEEQQT
ncbi:hypothetical protein ASAC_0405 [Acidilobus saccharovorans 345-15]|uniref:Uncharacterized protein n=1 Tax=Acidilobus saccharovorans (strain DSM 16705 / JCM 18335 / VKM B-2471 / 345-15) TaxID=666510 RepID=D9Q0H4_ACIS3|nr:hypothetical protein ASAC_0405 [Acidilobus saccharovorans 345-15]